MRVTLFTLGSRGDIQPLVVLARRLRQAGHSAVLATSPDFAGLAADYGVDFEPVGPPIATLMNDEVTKLVEGVAFSNCCVTASNKGERRRRSTFGKAGG